MQTIILFEKNKLIKLLGGFTKDEVNELIECKGTREYYRGRKIEASNIVNKADDIYGVDKQVWIDTIYNLARKDYYLSVNYFNEAVRNYKTIHTKYFKK